MKLKELVASRLELDVECWDTYTSFPVDILRKEFDGVEVWVCSEKRKPVLCCLEFKDFRLNLKIKETGKYIDVYSDYPYLYYDKFDCINHYIQILLQRKEKLQKKIERNKKLIEQLEGY